MIIVILICMGYIALFGALIITPTFLYFAGEAGKREDERRAAAYQESLRLAKIAREKRHQDELNRLDGKEAIVNGQQ